MATDQVERLTREIGNTQPIHPRDVREIMDEIVVQPHAAPHTVKDFIAQETEDPMSPGESRGVQAFLTGLSWAMFSVALVALGWLTVTVGKEYIAH